MASNLRGLFNRLLQCTCAYHIYCLPHPGLNILDTCIEIVCEPKPVDCFKARILLKVFNIEQLLLKAVIKGWIEFFKFLIPYAKNEGIDFSKPLPNIHEEPYNKRPLLHNLVCTQHCHHHILDILLTELNVDVFEKDGNGCRAIELALKQLPMDVRVDPNASLRNRNYVWIVLFRYSDFLRARRSLDWPDWPSLNSMYDLYMHAFYNYELWSSMKYTITYLWYLQLYALA